MKYLFQTVVKNFSRYEKSLVWKNALDLEHVTVLHPDTNAEFHLLGTFPSGREDYDVMVYRAKRRLFLFRINSFGFRKVISPYNLHQVEYLPLFGITLALNSVLRDSSNPSYKTEMVDELVVQMPAVLKPLQNYMIRSLQRHAKIQCEQDEPFRQRLEELELKGISFPYRLFETPLFDILTSRFREKI